MKRNGVDEYRQAQHLRFKRMKLEQKFASVIAMTPKQKALYTFTRFFNTIVHKWRTCTFLSLQNRAPGAGVFRKHLPSCGIFIDLHELPSLTAYLPPEVVTDCIRQKKKIDNCMYMQTFEYNQCLVMDQKKSGYVL
jgi:hypothetical protein